MRKAWGWNCASEFPLQVRQLDRIVLFAAKSKLIRQAAFMSESMPSVPFPSSYWVVPGQLLAGEHPVEFNEEDTRARLNALLDVGVRTFVNLTEERERMQSYAHQLQALAKDRGLAVEILRIPIPDRSVPSAETLTSILDVMDRSMANGQPVFVHCFAGVGRTGTVVGCYLMRHGRATGQNVIETIVELRSHMPGGAEASPHTAEQVQRVKSWKVAS